MSHFCFNDSIIELHNLVWNLTIMFSSLIWDDKVSCASMEASASELFYKGVFKFEVACLIFDLEKVFI